MSWIINLEIYSLWVRSIGNVIFTVINWFFNFVVVMLFLILIESIIKYGELKFEIIGKFLLVYYIRL